jgi:hypothetical protein
VPPTLQTNMNIRLSHLRAPVCAGVLMRVLAPGLQHMQLG